MCRPATCSTCGKTTWAGCGQHVDQVLRNVPNNQRCACPPDKRVVGGKGLLARLFGR
jgi:hypothetical protein